MTIVDGNANGGLQPALARLRAALQQAGAAGPAWAAALRPGLPAQAARAVLRPWSRTPPAALLALYGWADGLGGERTLVPGGRFPSAAEALANWRSLDASATRIAAATGAPADATWSTRWWPLFAAAPEAGEGGWWFTTAPARGQIDAPVWFKDREDAAVMAYDSLAALARTVAECLERGACELGEASLQTADGDAAAALFRQHNPHAAGEAAAGRDAAAVVAGLLQQLAQGDGRAKGEAAALLIKRRDRQAVPGLIALLSAADPVVRGLTARVLEASRDARALPALVQRLADVDVNARNHAAMALAALGDPAAVGPLLAALGIGAPLQNAGIMRALGQLNAVQAIDALVPLLAPAQALPVRLTALAALGAMTDPRLPACLLPLLEDANPQLRAAAASGLGKPGYDAAIDPLLACLDETATPLGLVAAGALGAIGGARALDGLQRASSGAAAGRDAALRAAIERAILALSRPPRT